MLFSIRIIEPKSLTPRITPLRGTIGSFAILVTYRELTATTRV